MAEPSGVTTISHGDNARIGSSCALNGFANPHHHRGMAIPPAAIDDGRAAGGLRRRRRPGGIEVSRLCLFRILREPHRSVRGHTAQIGLDKVLGDDRGGRRGAPNGEEHLVGHLGQLRFTE
jgi:hypothetical protein